MYYLNNIYIILYIIQMTDNYQTKYLKYKFKYLTQKELIGAAGPTLKFGTEQCPENFFNLFGVQRGIKYYLETYNCKYDDLVKKLDKQKLDKQTLDFTQLIFSVDDINNLIKREFPLLFFLDKKENIENLFNAGFNYNNLIKSGLDEKTILEKFKHFTFGIRFLYHFQFSIKQILEQATYYTLLNEFLNDMNSRPSEWMKKNPIRYKMLKEAGFSPIELYVDRFMKDSNKYKLIIKYLDTMHKGRGQIGQFHSENENTSKIFNFRNNTWDFETLKKLISISYFKVLFSVVNYSWNMGQFHFTQEEENKIKGLVELEEKDYKVSLKNIGTAADFKQLDYNAVELKDAGFTLLELKDAGFSSEELQTADFTIDEINRVALEQESRNEQQRNQDIETRRRIEAARLNPSPEGLQRGQDVYSYPTIQTLDTGPVLQRRIEAERLNPSPEGLQRGQYVYSYPPIQTLDTGPVLQSSQL